MLSERATIIGHFGRCRGPERGGSDDAGDGQGGVFFGAEPYFLFLRAQKLLQMELTS